VSKDWFHRSHAHLEKGTKPLPDPGVLLQVQETPQRGTGLFPLAEARPRPCQVEVVFRMDRCQPHCLFETLNGVFHLPLLVVFQVLDVVGGRPFPRVFGSFLAGARVCPFKELRTFPCSPSQHILAQSHKDAKEVTELFFPLQYTVSGQHRLQSGDSNLQHRLIRLASSQSL
jgi:hypothetical protein